MLAYCPRFVSFDERKMFLCACKFFEGDGVLTVQYFLILCLKLFWFKGFLLRCFWFCYRLINVLVLIALFFCISSGAKIGFTSVEN